MASMSSNMCIFSLPPQEAGLKEGDYIISVNGKDCKWSKHAEVVQLLKSTGEEGVEISVITLQGSEGPKAVSHIPSLRWETAEEVPQCLAPRLEVQDLKLGITSAAQVLPWLHASLRSPSQTGGQEGSGDVLGLSLIHI